MSSFGKALERIDEIDKTIDTKLDAKFGEVLACLPPHASSATPLQQQPQPPRRRNLAARVKRVPLEEGQNSGVVATAVAASMALDAHTKEDDDYEGDYEDDVDPHQNYVQPPAPGRPHAYNRNGRAASPPQV